MHRFVSSVFIAGAACACIATAAHAGLCQQDVCVRIEPANSIVQVNDVFSVQIVADINRSVVGWGLDFGLATAGVVSQQGAPTIGPAWFAASAPDGDGLAGLAFPSGISGDGIPLAALTLRADAMGETDLLLSATPDDFTEGFALDPTGSAIMAFQPGHVTIVPEPAVLSFVFCVISLRRITRRRCCAVTLQVPRAQCVSPTKRHCESPRLS